MCTGGAANRASLSAWWNEEACEESDAAGSGDGFEGAPRPVVCIMTSGGRMKSLPTRWSGEVVEDTLSEWWQDSAAHSENQAPSKGGASMTAFGAMLNFTIFTKDVEPEDVEPEDLRCPQEEPSTLGDLYRFCGRFAIVLDATFQSMICGDL